ncbi:MAG TPA: hypothetical protein VMO47_05850 [Rhodothermales bacterium]|nr:hypothetical protein [Rhodothermales bacterium]
MTLEAIEYLDRYLTKSMDMFEWGSGGSTVFFAERVRTVCTIEHDQSWGARVRHELNRREISNVDLEVVAPTVSSDPGTSVEEPIWDNRPEYANLDFRAYVETIEKWPDASLDLAVVDGRCRPDCIRYATRKVKPMGLLVVDNSERAAYRAALSTVAHWYTRHFFGPVVGCSLFSRTSVYVKPER